MTTLALAQQYHLDALTLHGGNFPAQRRLQLPDFHRAPAGGLNAMNL
jgi:hypothetical protein